MKEDDYLLFQVRGIDFAVPIGEVLHILRRPALLRLPDAPPDLLGVVEYHQRNIPLVDLGGKLRAAREEESGVAWVLLIQLKQWPELPFGFPVDRTQGIFSCASEEVDRRDQPYPHALKSALVAGIIKKLGKTILLLDLNRLMEAYHFPP